MSFDNKLRLRIDLVEMFRRYMPKLDHSQFENTDLLILSFDMSQPLTKEQEQETIDAITYTLSQYWKQFVRKYGFYRMAEILPLLLETVRFNLNNIAYTFNFYENEKYCWEKPDEEAA